MTDPIGRLVAWVSLLLTPRGTHRRTDPRPAARATPPGPDPTGMPPLPTHRSPYGLPTALNGAETVAVRPYVLLPAPYELETAA